jgi:hypothetical protein
MWRKIGCFASIAGTLALASCWGGLESGNSLPPAAPDAAAAMSQARGRSHSGSLYVASFSPYFFDRFALPLRTGERRALSVRSVHEPVPLGVDGGHVYVGSFSDGVIYTFSLPLQDAGQAQPPVPSSIFSPGLGDLSAISVRDGVLYLAGSDGSGEEVRAYKLPLMENESPLASLTGFSNFDFIGLAAQRQTLYVASAASGTIGAYRLPMKTQERPEYTISTQAQVNGVVGVAVNAGGSRLYVSTYSAGEFASYALPYKAGEEPVTVDAAAQGFGSPFGIAVGADHVFITAAYIVSYRLPITPSEMPDAIASFEGNGAGLAVGQ